MKMKLLLLGGLIKSWAAGTRSHIYYRLIRKIAPDHCNHRHRAPIRTSSDEKQLSKKLGSTI